MAVAPIAILHGCSFKISGLDNNAGGIANIASAIGEDHALSKMLNRIGRKTVITKDVVKQEIGARCLSDVWNRQFRWSVCRRVEEPAAFYSEPLASAVFSAAMGAIGAPVFGLNTLTIVAGTIALWIAAEIFLVSIKGWNLSWKLPFAVFSSMCIFPIIWMQALFARRMSWGSVSLDIRGPMQSNKD